MDILIDGDTEGEKAKSRRENNFSPFTRGLWSVVTGFREIVSWKQETSNEI